MASGSLARATFKNEETGEVFTVQFNPKEFKLDKKVKWKDKDSIGADPEDIEFQSVSPLKVTMELFFDTTATMEDVRTKWVDPLLSLTNAKYQPQSTSEGSKEKKQVPPKLLFSWGSFSLRCVVESLQVSYLMFATDGKPLRARCSLSLKEARVSEFSGSAGQAEDVKFYRLVEAGAGDTASSIAARHGADVRAVCAQNDIDDPLEELAGREIVVPLGGVEDLPERFSDPMAEVDDLLDELAAAEEDPLEAFGAAGRKLAEQELDR